MASFGAGRRLLRILARGVPALFTVAAAAAYAGAFVLLHPALGEVAGALTVLPIALAAVLYGRGVGLLLAALSLPVNAALYASVGEVEITRVSLTLGVAAAGVGAAIEVVRRGARRDKPAAAAPFSPALIPEIPSPPTSAPVSDVAEVGDDRHAPARPLFDLHPAPSFVTRLSDGVIVEANEALLRALARSREDVIGKRADEVGLWEDENGRAAYVAELRARGGPNGIEFRGRARSGERRVFLGSAMILDADGARYALESVLDVTDLRRARPEPPRAELVEGDPGPRLRDDPALLLVSRLDDDVVLEASDSLLAVLGATRDQLVGRAAPQLGPLADPARRTSLLEALRRHGTVRDVEFAIRDRAGVIREVVASVALIQDGGTTCVATSAIEITERKRRERHLAQRALSDELTGLPNRGLLRDRIAHAVRGAQGSAGTAVLVVELESAVDVVQSFGPTVADELVREAGRRLAVRVRSNDTVARVGPASFGVLLPETAPAAARQAAAVLLEALRAPFALGAVRLGSESRVGIAAHPGDGDDAETLLRRAEAAIRLARGAGSSIEEYRPAEEHYEDPSALLADLADAIAADGLSLDYQPEIEVRTGRVFAAEALVRWRHPSRGPLAPADFVPAAERAGLSRGLTRWVIGRALVDCRAWRSESSELRVAVNVAARDLLDPELPDTVGDLLRSTGLRPSALLLDLPEGALARDARSRPVVGRLERLGVTLALDDVGATSFPLGRVDRFGVRQVKLDGGLVRGLTRNPTHTAFVRAAIEACHASGVQVLAEAVEDDETLRLLREMGCDLVQGFLLARPMPAAAMPGWMARMSGSDLAGLRQRLSQGSRGRTA